MSPALLAAFDEPAALESCTRWLPDAGAPGDGGIGESTLALDGLHCAACAGLIEAALAPLPGVASARVNAAARRLTVRWDARRTRLSAIAAAVQAAGYQAVPAGRAAAAELRRAEERRALWRLLVAGFCMMQVMMLTAPGWFAAPGELAPEHAALLAWGAWVLTLPVLLFACGPFFAGAWQALRRRRIGMDVPVTLGIVITFVAGTGATFDPGGAFGGDAYLDSLTMFVAFLLAGRWLEARARTRSTEALDTLLQRLPDSVERLDADGRWQRVAPSRLAAGDRVRIAAGQAFPGDGTLLDGPTQVDESLLSGESRPLPRAAGEAVVGGSLNLGGPVMVVLDRVGAGTRHAQIVDLVERALAERPALVRAADRAAAPFLWGVLVLAAGAAAAWSLIDPGRVAWVVASVLIVTCPCALSLAAPSALLAATGALARRGVLVQRLDALEALARCDTACLDKTGTLTGERLAVARVLHDATADRDALLARAAALAALSHHPLAQSLADAVPAAGLGGWSAVVEVPGCGIEARDPQGRTWRLGAPSWVSGDADGRDAAGAGPGRPRIAFGPRRAPAPAAGTGAAAQTLVVEFDERLRPDAQASLAALRRAGLALHLLSGDGEAAVRRLAAGLPFESARGGCTPEAKCEAIGALQATGRTVVMAGDGLNDGPVLARADVSFALAHGSELARRRADFVVLGSRLAALPEALALARRAARIVRQNLAWAAAYNAVCVPLALAGLLPPWAAGAGMALSSLLVVGNALRLSR